MRVTQGKEKLTWSLSDADRTDPDPAVVLLPPKARHRHLPTRLASFPKWWLWEEQQVKSRKGAQDELQLEAHSLTHPGVTDGSKRKANTCRYLLPSVSFSLPSCLTWYGKTPRVKEVSRSHKVHKDVYYVVFVVVLFLTIAFVTGEQSQTL